MILFLDTISPKPTFSIIKDNIVIHSIQILNKKNIKISDSLIPTFLEIKKKIKTLNNIDKLIVGTGPGSYTALRVGIGFMFGLSFSTNIPLIGISYPEILKNFITSKVLKKSLVMICSTNDQNYLYFYDNDKIFNIKKIDFNSSINNINLNKYDYIFSNYKLSSNTLKMFKINKYKIYNFVDLISLNYKFILSKNINNVIKPIYISDNNLFN